MLIDAKNHVSTFAVRYTVNRTVRKSLNNTEFVAFHRNIDRTRLDATSLNLVTRLVPRGYVFDAYTIAGTGAYYPNRFWQM